MTNLRSQYRHLASDRRGGIAIIFALTAPVLAGFVSLGVEVGMWYQTKAKLQAIADTAAIAGAREMSYGSDLTLVADAVTTAGEQNICGSGDTSCLRDGTAAITIDTPTYFRSSDANTEGNNGVEVVARTSVTTLLAQLFLPTSADGNVEIVATGKARYTVDTTPGTTTTTTTTTTTSTGGTSVACVLGLDNNAAYTVWEKNNAIVNCPVVSNSTCQGQDSTKCTLDEAKYGSYNCSPNIDPQCHASLSNTAISSLYLNENAQIKADASAAGAIHLDNNAKITGLKLPFATQVANPYASVPFSPPSGSDALTITGSGTEGDKYNISVSTGSGHCGSDSGHSGVLTYKNNVFLIIQPGCYNGWDFDNNAFVTLTAGTYYIKSKFSLGNNSTITATDGTTIIFVGNYAISTGNNATLKINAPNSGSYKGIALMGDPNGTATVVQTFANNTIFKINGAIYFRNQIVNLENNSISDATECFQLIARRVLLSNNVNLTSGSGCPVDIGTIQFYTGEVIQTTPTTVTVTTEGTSTTSVGLGE